MFIDDLLLKNADLPLQTLKFHQIPTIRAAPKWRLLQILLSHLWLRDEAADGGNGAGHILVFFRHGT